MEWWEGLASGYQSDQKPQVYQDRDEVQWVLRNTNFANNCSKRKEYLSQTLAGPVPKIPPKRVIKLQVREIKWPVSQLLFSCGADAVIARGRPGFLLGPPKALRDESQTDEGESYARIRTLMKASIAWLLPLHVVLCCAWAIGGVGWGIHISATQQLPSERLWSSWGSQASTDEPGSEQGPQVSAGWVLMRGEPVSAGTTRGASWKARDSRCAQRIGQSCFTGEWRRIAESQLQTGLWCLVPLCQLNIQQEYMLILSEVYKIHKEKIQSSCPLVREGGRKKKRKQWAHLCQFISQERERQRIKTSERRSDSDLCFIISHWHTWQVMFKLPILRKPAET